MAPLNPEAAEFAPASISSPPDHLLPTALFPPSSPPCCIPLHLCLDSHRPSQLPFLDCCPSPHFSIYNNSLNVYYASGFLWPGPDPLIKNPFPDPLWHYAHPLASVPPARVPPSLSLLPQPDDQTAVVEGQKSCVGEGEDEEVVASSRSISIVRARQRAGGRKPMRSASQSQWRKIERSQSPEQRRGMQQQQQRWRPRRGSGENYSLHQQGEEEAHHTTLMIRNIPNKFTRKMLLEDLDKQCLEHNENLRREDDSNADFLSYDFVYLPIDFRTRCNRGYAFVNLTSASGACSLREAYRGRKWNAFGSRKTCDIFYANIQRIPSAICWYIGLIELRAGNAKRNSKYAMEYLQGKEALEDHFKRSCFLCDSDDFLPILFDPCRNGSSVFVASNVGKRVPPPPPS